MLVTDIRPYSQDKSRVSIYLDGEFSFVLYKGELSEYKINCDEEISGETYNRIVREILIPRAKKRGMNLLMTQDRTRADVYSKLKEGGYPEEVIEEAVRYLESFHYIDDDRYARNYIYYKASSMSRKQMRMKLIQKGIDTDLLDNIFAELSQERESIEYSDGQESYISDELKLIEKLMLKKSKGDVKALDYNGKQKLFAYLYNKGFAINDIEKVYNYLT